MWMNLTTLTNKQAIVDMDKVLHLFEVSNGTNIYYGISEANNKGQQVLKHITVKEPIDVISRRLRARKP